MDLRELRTFRAVAELGSLSRAASYLHTAQPALSRHIKLLESDLRQLLFNRDGRGMRLTPAGHYLYEQTSGLLSSVDHLRDNVRSFEAQPDGDVVLGMVPTVSTLISAEVAVRTIEQYPYVRLRLSDGYTGHLKDWMNRGDLDLAVMYEEGPASDSSEVLIKEQLCAVGVPEAFGPIGTTDEHGSVSLDDLFSLPLVLPSRQHPLRRIIESGATTKAAELEVVVEADSFRVQLGIAATGKGITILPEYALRSTQDSSALRIRRITGSPLQRTIALVRPVGTARSVAVDAVAEIVRELVYDVLT